MNEEIPQSPLVLDAEVIFGRMVFLISHMENIHVQVKPEDPPMPLVSLPAELAIRVVFHILMHENPPQNMPWLLLPEDLKFNEG